MYYCKDSESFGTGLQRIVEACAQAQVKVEFREMKLGFMVVFYRPKNHINVDDEQLIGSNIADDPINDPINVSLNEMQKLIVALLKKDKTATYEVLATRIGVSAATIKRNLKHLQEIGILKRAGSKKTGFWEIIPDGGKDSRS
jgi:ATP-dependent DNA helicase RecG